jgi:hypothetical protein
MSNQDSKAFVLRVLPSVFKPTIVIQQIYLGKNTGFQTNPQSPLVFSKHVFPPFKKKNQDSLQCA